MAPKEGNSIVKHGVLDERLNVHGVKNLKVSDLSICPDNVGCNTFSVSFVSSFSSYALLTTYLHRLPSSSAKSVLSWLLKISATAVLLLT
jgi:choline dehydrogenase-like flavoprotein